MLKSNFEVPVIMSIVLFLALTSMCLPALALGFRCEYAAIDCSSVRYCEDSSKSEGITGLCHAVPRPNGEVWIIPKDSMELCLNGNKDEVFAYPRNKFEGRACKFQCPEISTRYDECMLKKGKGTPKHLMGILDRTCRRDACQPLG